MQQKNYVHIPSTTVRFVGVPKRLDAPQKKGCASPITPRGDYGARQRGRPIQNKNWSGNRKSLVYNYIRSLHVLTD